MNEEKVLKLFKNKENEINELKRSLRLSHYNHTQTKKRLKEIQGMYKTLLNSKVDEFCNQ